MVSAMHDLNFIEHLFYTFFSVGTFHPCIDKRQFYIFKNGKLINKIKTLEYKSNVVFTEVCAFALVEMRYLNSVEKKTATIRIIEQAKNIKQCRFAATGRPHHCNKFSFFYCH